jgi:hypothetical protein
MDLIISIGDVEKVWKPGSVKIMNLTKVSMKFKKALLKYFTMFMLDEYKKALRKAITSQRFIDQWAPLSERYLKYKKEMGYSTKIWECTSLLKHSIRSWPVGTDAYAIGIDPKANYRTETGVDLNVRNVAMWMEFGTGERAEDGKGTPGWPGMPPRPLFRPLRDNMSRKINVWFSKFVDDYAEEIDTMLSMSLFGMEVV